MDEILRNLQKTLRAAADSNSNAIIGPKEARQGADAIERVEDNRPWQAGDTLHGPKTS